MLVVQMEPLAIQWILVVKMHACYVMMCDDNDDNDDNDDDDDH
jgi:hypothetical protein